LKNIGSLIKILSIPKIINYLYAELSHHFRMDTSFGKPRSLFIEPSNTCNLKCAICPTGRGVLKRSKAMMSFEDFKKIIDELRNTLLGVTFAGYGEPFLNKNTIDMVKYAKKAGLYVEVYTNLLMLDERSIRILIDNKIDRLITSVDATSEETYKKHKRAGSFSETVKILKLINEQKQRAKSKLPHIKLSFVVMKHNVQEMEKMKLLVKEVGADSLVYKCMNVKMAGGDIGANEQEFLVEDFNRYKDPPKGKGDCPWAYRGSLVYSNGDVAPCCYISGGENTMGNVFSSSFSEIWNGKKYRNFRRTLKEDIDKLPFCSTCLAKYKGGLGG
jgi:radical SAM protein with 4Fe4S-binding SPASM domain